MKEPSPYCHGFKMDRLIKISTDNIMSHIPTGEYSPVPPPIADFFLLLDGTNFLLLDNTPFLLL